MITWTKAIKLFKTNTSIQNNNNKTRQGHWNICIIETSELKMLVDIPFYVSQLLWRGSSVYRIYKGDWWWCHVNLWAVFDCFTWDYARILKTIRWAVSLVNSSTELAWNIDLLLEIKEAREVKCYIVSRGKNLVAWKKGHFIKLLYLN